MQEKKQVHQIAQATLSRAPQGFRVPLALVEELTGICS